MPTHALNNGLHLAAVPDVVSCLNWLEVILISPVRVLQSIVQLQPYSKRRGPPSHLVSASRGIAVYVQFVYNCIPIPKYLIMHFFCFSYLSNPVGGTVSHVLKTLPSMDNLEIIVKTRRATGLEKLIGVSMDKVVYLLLIGSIVL